MVGVLFNTVECRGRLLDSLGATIEELKVGKVKFDNNFDISSSVGEDFFFCPSQNNLMLHTSR
jgi:hypothetical protein